MDGHFVGHQCTGHHRATSRPSQRCNMLMTFQSFQYSCTFCLHWIFSHHRKGMEGCIYRTNYASCRGGFNIFTFERVGKHVTFSISGFSGRRPTKLLKLLILSPNRTAERGSSGRLEWLGSSTCSRWSTAITSCNLFSSYGGLSNWTTCVCICRIGGSCNQKVRYGKIQKQQDSCKFEWQVLLLAVLFTTVGISTMFRETRCKKALGKVYVVSSKWGLCGPLKFHWMMVVASEKQVAWTCVDYIVVGVFDKWFTSRTSSRGTTQNSMKHKTS